MRKTIVIALGGNALIRDGKQATYQEQARNIEIVAKQIARIARSGWRVAITHGNGPQVGNLLIQQKAGGNAVPPQPMHVCGAMSQGQIGYMLQQAIAREAGIPVATVITQVLVDPKDPAFRHPTKPVGPFYAKKQPGMVWDSGRGWRKVVPSPDPKGIVEAKAIRAMVDGGITVIASGGGGIPVVKKGRSLHGVEAVIDKDLAAERLATSLNAEVLLILTPVPQVFLDFGTKRQRPIRKLNLPLAKNYLRQGQFAEGSMGPKVLAAIRFIENGGKLAVITSPGLACEALAGKAGTVISW